MPTPSKRQQQWMAATVGGSNSRRRQQRTAAAADGDNNSRRQHTATTADGSKSKSWNQQAAKAYGGNSGLQHSGRATGNAVSNRSLTQAASLRFPFARGVHPKNDLCQYGHFQKCITPSTEQIVQLYYCNHFFRKNLVMSTPNLHAFWSN